MQYGSELSELFRGCNETCEAILSGASLIVTVKQFMDRYTQSKKGQPYRIFAVCMGIT